MHVRWRFTLVMELVAKRSAQAACSASGERLRALPPDRPGPNASADLAECSMHSNDDQIILPGSPVTHASHEAEHAHLREEWEATLGPKAEAFVARAMARAAVIVTARKTPES
jgi:hypothetical protein